MSNPLDATLNQFESHGLKPILKRRMLDEYGREHFVDASENEILNLQNQSRLAVTAHNLLNLSVEDRTFWAIEMKRQANELFRKGLFEEASAQYLEAMTASNLDNADSGGNVDDVVVPLLCNIAACNIQMKAWRKTIAICEQALLLRPRAIKALTRLGLACIQIGELDKAEVALRKAQEVLASLSSLETERDGCDQHAEGKVNALLADLAKRRTVSAAAYQKRRHAMATVFGNDRSKSGNNSSQGEKSNTVKKASYFPVYLKVSALIVACIGISVIHFFVFRKKHL